jgi:hypothetical protein
MNGFKWEYEDTPHGRRYVSVPIVESNAFEIDPETGKALTGFALMEKDEVTEAARKGGKTAHEQGKAHQFTSQEARAAALKSAKVRQRKKARREKAKAKREHVERYAPEYPKPEIIIAMSEPNE